MTNLLPYSYVRLPSLWGDDNDWGAETNLPSGLSISEDEKNVYVQAAVPGVEPKDIEVTIDHGVVWIKGETNVQSDNKKFYRRAVRSFSYRVAIPGDIDPNAEPEAKAKNGIMTVAFSKSPKSQPRKISVKEDK